MNDYYVEEKYRYIFENSPVVYNMSGLFVDVRDIMKDTLANMLVRTHVRATIMNLRDHIKDDGGTLTIGRKWAASQLFIDWSDPVAREDWWTSGGSQAKSAMGHWSDDFLPINRYSCTPVILGWINKNSLPFRFSDDVESVVLMDFDIGSVWVGPDDVMWDVHEKRYGVPEITLVDDGDWYTPPGFTNLEIQGRTVDVIRITERLSPSVLRMMRQRI